MRWIIIVSLAALSACSLGLPGRQTLAPDPVAPDVSSVAATRAFAGRIALVRIAPGTEDFAAPLKDAVAQGIAGDGVQPGHVTLTAGTGGKSAAVLVYVK